MIACPSQHLQRGRAVESTRQQQRQGASNGGSFNFQLPTGRYGRYYFLFTHVHNGFAVDLASAGTERKKTESSFSECLR
jgi:hypothetical protein